MSLPLRAGSRHSVEWRVIVTADRQEYPSLIWIGDDERAAREVYEMERKRWADVAGASARLERRAVAVWESWIHEGGES